MRYFLLLITIAAALTISVTGQTVPTKKAVKVLVYDQNRIIGEDAVPPLLELKRTADGICAETKVRNAEIDRQLRRRWALLLDLNASYQQLMDRRRLLNELVIEAVQRQKNCDAARNNAGRLEWRIIEFIESIATASDALAIPYGWNYFFPTTQRFGADMYYRDPRIDRTGQLRLAVLSYLLSGEIPAIDVEIPEVKTAVIELNSVINASLGNAEFKRVMSEYRQRLRELELNAEMQLQTPMSLYKRGDIAKLNRDDLMVGQPVEVTELDRVVEDFAISYGVELIIDARTFSLVKSRGLIDARSDFKTYFSNRIDDLRLSGTFRIPNSPIP